ncbi:unnamed protein product [Didymodactylos carnosus]|uniref:RRM domain-containing protein n=1 Tax=Didymodactylos carnosus TaxID=1234261 RepID=A0A813SQK6_9BILA|nr:unnamed protein product [Didymodactylos carnosus]CAF3584129.1 unnamed protein product [Didymodactylos carnosus]
MSTNSSFIIRLQNLPNEAKAQDIRKFFAGLSIPDGGVHVVGGEKGDAFIAFNTDDDARQAMMKEGSILNNPIKLFLSSRSEMSEIVAKARTQPTGLTKKPSESTTVTTTSATSNFHSSYYPNFSNANSTPITTTTTTATSEMTKNTAQPPSSNNLANELAAILNALQSQQTPPLLDTSTIKSPNTFAHPQQGTVSPSFNQNPVQSGVGSGNQTGQVPNIQALLQLLTEKNIPGFQQQQPTFQMPFHPPFNNQVPPVQRFGQSMPQPQQSNGGWIAQSPVITNTFNHHQNVPSLYQHPLQTQQQLMSHQRSLPLIQDDNSNRQGVINSHSSESTTSTTTGSSSSSSLYGPSSSTTKQQQSLADEPYIKIKNIPVTFTYSDIKMFFNKYKLNLSDIKIINDHNGQRTGEIVLRLHSNNDVSELLNLNGRIQCMNNYLDIRKIDEYTFASSIDSFIPTALSKKKALIPTNCVKVLQLPPKWDKRDIKRYFNGCNLTRDRNGGIFFELDNNEMNRGPTYIEFEHEIDVEKAMFYNGEIVENSKIEVCRMTKSEMDNEISNSKRRDRRRPPLLTHDGEPNRSSPLVLNPPAHRSNETRYTRPDNHYSNNSNNSQQQQIDHSSPHHQQNSYQTFLFHQQQYPSPITCLRLRNIPYTTTENQIRDYFQSINVNIESCKLLNDKFGRQAGEAFVRFHDTQSCQQAYEKKQRQIFYGRCLDIRPLALTEFNQNPSPLPMNEGRDATPRSSNDLQQQQQQKRSYYEERKRTYDDKQKRLRFNNGYHSQDDQRHTSSPIQNLDDLNSTTDYQQRATSIRHNNTSSDPNNLSNLPPLPEHMEVYRGRILYLSNVAYRATREEILDLLKPFNPIEETLKIRCDSSGKPTGFAVVACAEPHDAQNAVSNLNNQTFIFRKIYLAQK